ncbi:MAG: PepSY domain-containing protein [Acetobacter sp.]|uniref:PepSY-associated TM helix domain-containing protein n=1 Tax=Acetobacter sp. TaxID=440 RepID=UPI0039EB2343
MKHLATGLWPDRRTVWRWHFFAGLFCLPFIVLLSLTGSLYLFKPQIEALIDYPYDHLPAARAPTPMREVEAALEAVPGSTLLAYEVPPTVQGAARVIVNRNGQAIRVYVERTSHKVLKTVAEEQRFERLVFKLHGQLLLGNVGSVIMEMVASWTVVLVLSGLWLWWPTDLRGLGGLLYPRLGRTGRALWRDIHAVSGVWVSGVLVLFLVSGLPWSFVWGHALSSVQHRVGRLVTVRDWEIGAVPVRDTLAGRPLPPGGAQAGAGHGVATADMAGQASASSASISSAGISAANASSASAGLGRTRSDNVRSGMAISAADTAMDMPGMDMLPPAVPVSFPVGAMSGVDEVVRVATGLGLPPPVLVTPPATPGGPWTIRSDTQNRPLRQSVTVSPDGRILSHETFDQKGLVDRIIGYGVAAHEGHLFGWANQVLNLLVAIALMLMSGAATVLWLRRRPPGELGAPPAHRSQRMGVATVGLVCVLGVLLPELGLSLSVLAGAAWLARQLGHGR